MAELHAGIDWRALLDALGRADVEGAITSLGLDRSAFYAMGTAKAAAFMEAGAIATVSIPGTAIGIRFDMRDPSAEQWIAREVWGQIDGWMAEEQLRAVRDTISTGFAAGRHPHSIATDIAGRVVGGARQGGVIGLDAGRARRLNEVTRLMQTAEGVQSLVIERRDGTLRLRYATNRATEQRILRAYRHGEAVSSADQAISARQFSNALLKSRAEQLAQDSSAEAVFAGRREAWVQVLAKRGYPPEAVLKTWRHGGGPQDPRPHHVAMNGQTVRGLDAEFEFSNGSHLRFPLDPQGAVSETTKCTCMCDFRLDPRWGIE